MLLPQNFEHKIGFAALRQRLEANCLSALGRQYVAKLEFQTKAEPLLKLLQQTNEFAFLLRLGADFPASHYYDPQVHFKRAALPGAFLDIAAFFEVKMSLRTIRQALTFFTQAPEEQYPTLRLLASACKWTAT